MIKLEVKNTSKRLHYFGSEIAPGRTVEVDPSQVRPGVRHVLHASKRVSTEPLPPPELELYAVGEGRRVRIETVEMFEAVFFPPTQEKRSRKSAPVEETPPSES